ncbi:hypothetical protein [Cetobacterium sp.]
MSIADFKKNYYSLFEKATPDTALLNYAGLRTLIELTVYRELEVEEIEEIINAGRNKSIEHE